MPFPFILQFEISVCSFLCLSLILYTWSHGMPLVFMSMNYKLNLAIFDIFKSVHLINAVHIADIDLFQY